MSPEEEGWWWSVLGREPIGFAGLQRSQRFYDTGYLCRSGVMPEHRGHGLQFRLIRVRELQAKRNGWRWCITDTTDNIASANSLIKAGYTLYRPSAPWAFTKTLYWRKKLAK